jgi:hypothetical protein
MFQKVGDLRHYIIVVFNDFDREIPHIPFPDAVTRYLRNAMKELRIIDNAPRQY